MKVPVVLGLDLSLHTGYAVFQGPNEIIAYGLIESVVEDYRSQITKHSELPSVYPRNFIVAAEDVASKCQQIWQAFKPDLVVIEHTEGSSRRFSQRLLEFIHFAVTKSLYNDQVTFKYLLNSDWRRPLNCYISQWPEVIRWNRRVASLKRKAARTRTGARVARLNSRVPPELVELYREYVPNSRADIVRRIDHKDLSIKIANDAFGLKLDDDNIADAINLVRSSYFLNVLGE